MANVLYLAVLPIVHISNTPSGFGLTEQVLTLFPDKDLATEFTAGQVDGYMELFKVRSLTYLVGGEITGYEFEKMVLENGRVIVKVTQNVA
jgi:hypothetical protein